MSYMVKAEAFRWTENERKRLAGRLVELEAENERLRADYETCSEAHAVLRERLAKVRLALRGTTE